MMKRTHIAVGLAVATPIIMKFDLHVVSFLGVIGATAPDWDFYLGIQHRTYTHSLLLTTISTMIIAYLGSWNVGMIWGLCYLSHLLLDSLTIMGVPFLYPFIKKRRGIRKFRTGDGEDYFIQLVAIYFIANNFI